MPDSRELVLRAYDVFNRRDITAALAMMHPDVQWPNGMRGGYVYGPDQVRDYWTRQWTLIDPRVEPEHVEVDDTGRIVVTVHQVVRDLAGKVLADRMVEHVYHVEDNLIRSMEIRDP